MLEELAKRAASELRLREAAIDEVMSGARRVRVLSKQAILQINSDAIQGAEVKLRDAGRLLQEIKEIIREKPELGCFGQVNAAMEEHAEAKILYRLKTSDEFPDPDEVGVPLKAYILGLGDVPGELRRQALDALRVGDLELAESRLRTMEHVYLTLISMEEGTYLKGLRRKLDIARGVIERTRSDLTAEAGRRRLDESLRRLADRLE